LESDAGAGHVWREERIDGLLARSRDVTLYVSGTVSNQGSFYPRFDAVVLLSAPAEVLLTREDRAMILGHLAEIEPAAARHLHA
jgi:hypothetical protein